MLTFDYPIWYILFCAMAGVGYASLQYFRERSFEEISVWWRRLMYFLRFAATSILAFLLLSPLLRRNETDTKKPVVVVASDNSESMRVGMKSADTAAFAKNMRELARQLGEAYEVHTYAVGDQLNDGLRFGFTDKITNLSKVFEEVYDAYSNQNLGAVILATDGIYNQGNNPLYTAQKLNVPVYTVAIGDTVAKKDVVLKRVYNNQIAYLGDEFTVQIDVSARNCKGNTTNLTVSKGNAAPSKSQNIGIDSDDFFKTIDLTLKADAVGVQRYRVAVSAISGEVTTVNNTKEIVIEVIDARQKVLIVANAPHPDLSALKEAIIDNKNYDAEIQYLSDLKADPAKYDLFILHEVPGSSGAAQTLLAAIQAQRKPRWFILGNQSNLGAVGQAQQTLRVSGSINSTNEVQAVVAANFTPFRLNDKLLAQLPKFPPLIAPFGEYTADATASTLLNQKIGTVTTKYPLWVFGEKDGIKTSVLAGEGLRRWRLTDFITNKSFDNFNELIANTIQYLSVKNDKRKFRAYANKTLYDENENITIDAELYNDSYQRINEPEAKVVLRGAGGKEYPFSFSKISNYYTANAGLLPVGDYTFLASVTNNGQNLKSEGQFSVKSIQLEVFETQADHRLLRSLSAQTGGETVFANQIGSIVQKIKAKGSVKPMLFSTLRTRSLIDVKWIFFLLLTLLCGEWFLRKFHGGY